MRLLYKHCHEGIWFSQNGHAAYMRGEKPNFMWPEVFDFEATTEHHIARDYDKGKYTRELVMFGYGRRIK